MSIRNGRARRIREVLELFPGSTVADLCHALKEGQVKIWNSLDNMLDAGTVVRVPDTSPHGFMLGRPLAYEPSVTPEERLARRQALTRKHNASRSERRKRERAAVRVVAEVMSRQQAAPAPVIRAQTVDEFLAQGGKVEVLPVMWA